MQAAASVGLHEISWVTVPNVRETFLKAVEAGKATLNLEEKRISYNAAFKVLKEQAQRGPLDLEMQNSLFELFELYAAQTCYNQASPILDAKGDSIDDEEGMRKCARLMELSLVLQLKMLGLVSENYDWSKYDDLEQLIESLGSKPDEKGYFFPFMENIQIDPQTLLAAAYKNLRTGLRQTLRHLAYSYFNTESLYTKTYLALHEKLRGWTVALIGKESVEEIRVLADYRYDTNPRFVHLTLPPETTPPQACLAKNNCYIEVIDLLTIAYEVDHPTRVGKQSQIFNMMGINLLNNKFPVTEALPHFQQAFDLREKLYKAETDPAARSHQGYLLSNIRTGLIHCLVNMTASVESDIAIYRHVEGLKAYLAENREHKNYQSYQGTYSGAITKAASAVARLKKTVSALEAAGMVTVKIAF